MGTVAVLLAAFNTRGRLSDVAWVSAAEFLAYCFGGLASTIYLDRIDRRLGLVWTEGVLGCFALVLAIVWLWGPVPLQMPVLIVGSMGIGFFGCVGEALREAAMPQIATEETLGASLALNQLLFNSTGALGPLLGGGLTGLAGVGIVFFVNALSFFVGGIGYARIRFPPVVKVDHSETYTWREIGAGWISLVRSRALRIAVAIDLVAMVLVMPRSVFPVISDQIGWGSSGVGFLLSCFTVGAVIGAFLSRPVADTQRPLLIAAIAVFVFSGSFLTFSFCWEVPILAVLLVALAGAADSWSAVGRVRVVQEAVAPRFRARTFAAFMLLATCAPRLGDARAALAADWFGATASIQAFGLTGIIAISVLIWAVVRLERSRKDGK